MTAGDGATRTVGEPSCVQCGVDLMGEITVRVDEWSAFACRGCAGEVDFPPRCCVYPLPAEGADVEA